MSKKRVILLLIAVVFAFGAAGNVAAETQYDIGLNVPLYFGITASDTTEGGISDLSDYAFLVPDVKITYFFGDGNFKFGPGIRGFSFIVESLVYPTVNAQLEMDPITISAGVGGQLFAFFGLWNQFVSEPVYVADLSATYRMNDWLHLGAGATGLMLGDASTFKENMPYTIYALARFSFGD
ncbi:MAG: hypothetical protein ACQEQU_05690 [Spirochaetota bacterium]